MKRNRRSGNSHDLLREFVNSIMNDVFMTPKGHNHGRDQPSTHIEVGHEVDTWHDSDLCSHLMQDELDSLQSSMLSWQSPAEGERQHGSSPFSWTRRHKGPYFFDCEPSSPVASVTSELATPTLP